MASMTDPMAALVSFQHALFDGEIRLRAGELDPDLFVYADNLAPVVSRITYVRLDGRTVTAFVNVVANGLMDGLPCVQLGVQSLCNIRQFNDKRSMRFCNSTTWPTKKYMFPTCQSGLGD
jgi:hypothetical protein